MSFYPTIYVHLQYEGFGKLNLISLKNALSLSLMHCETRNNNNNNEIEKWAKKQVKMTSLRWIDDVNNKHNNAATSAEMRASDAQFKQMHIRKVFESIQFMA